ncbi:MAG: hypothetical protein AAF960_03235 [Bacteroidota bacterium]
MDSLFASQKAKGCSSFYVFKENRQEGLHLAVKGDRDELQLSEMAQVFDLKTADLTVELLKFEGEIGQYACDDVVGDEGTVEQTWVAAEGQATLQILEDSISVQSWETTYRLQVKLKNIRLTAENKDDVRIDEVLFEDVYVGWLPG